MTHAKIYCSSDFGIKILYSKRRRDSIYIYFRIATVLEHVLIKIVSSIAFSFGFGGLFIFFPKIKIRSRDLNFNQNAQRGLQGDKNICILFYFQIEQFRKCIQNKNRYIKKYIYYVQLFRKSHLYKEAQIIKQHRFM